MKKLALCAAFLLAALLARSHFGSRVLPDGPRLDEGELIRTVSQGEALELSELLEDGKWTVVLFTAPWCPGCKQLEPRLEAAIRERGTVRLRRIDIETWNSPVARQHAIESIPQLWLHEGSELIATGADEVMRRIQP